MLDISFEERAKDLLKQVKQAQDRSPYGQKVTVCAATKTRTPEEINRLPEMGIHTIGENRVQELLEKYEQLDKEKLNIHFIGALQTNKVKYIIDKVCMIQSVDRLSLAQEIDRQAKKHGLIMDILCEINIGNEATKSGVSPEEAPSFVQELMEFSNLRVCGLMCIPPVCDKKEEQKKYFKKIMEIFIDITHKNMDNSIMRILSFGMSGDFETAIECGSTMIRPGVALFGPRNYQ